MNDVTPENSSAHLPSQTPPQTKEKAKLQLKRGRKTGSKNRLPSANRDANGLISLIEAEVKRRDMDNKQVYDELGVTTRQLRYLLAKGIKKPLDLDRQLSQSLANFLRTSVLNIHVLAGSIIEDDLFFQVDQNAQLDHYYSVMMNDAESAVYMPSKAEWESLSRRTKYGLVMLYEQARSKMVIERIQLMVPVEEELDPQGGE